MDAVKGNIKSDLRINVPINNIEKFKQVFLYILTKVGAYYNVGRTVLYKLLYFIDFDYYELYEEQLMGLEYIKKEHGPIPKDFLNIVEDMKNNKEVDEVHTKHFDYEMVKYFPCVEPDLSILSGRELEHIDATLNRLAHKSALDISEYSHKDIPWITAKFEHPIDYDAVFYRNEATSVRSYDN